ncbi:MAG: hypothetical protein SGBAC_001572 [Bacillariaceae sp.]
MGEEIIEEAEGILEESSSVTHRASSNIRHQIIPLPARCSRYLHPPENCMAISIPNFFSKLECDKLIQQAAIATEKGFQYITEASHISPDGTSYTVKLHNPNPHKLSVFDHPPTIAKMWSKLQTFFHPLIQDFVQREQCGPALGLNPRIRVLRYDFKDNDRFEPHFDATTMVGKTKQSLLTVLLYLNDGGGVDFEGGETLYLNSHISSKQQIESTMAKSTDSIVKVTPTAGTVVIFEHDLYHSGAPLYEGTKYVLRTDVVFSKKDGDSNIIGSEEKSTSDNEDESSRVLVSGLCDDLGLSQQMQDKLDEMEMLEMTIESFLAPGIIILTAMLQEELGDSETVDLLVRTACKLLKK